MITVSPPSLDKLSLTLSIDEVETAYITDRIYNSHHTSWSKGQNYRNRRYETNTELRLSEASQSEIMILSNPYSSSNANLQLELNPNRFLEVGCCYLWDNLLNLFDMDADRFCSITTVKRLDIACDVHPLVPDCIHAHAKGLQLGDIRTGPEGKLETVDIGYRGGKRSFCVYNRDKRTRKYVSDDQCTTRIEARLKPDTSLSDIGSLPNPFLSLIVCQNISYERLMQADMTERLFFRVASLSGLQSAMGLLGRTENKARMRKVIEDNFVPDWYDPNDIWRKYRGALLRAKLNELGIDIPRRVRYLKNL